MAQRNGPAARFVILVAVVSMIVAACSGDDEPAPTTAAPPPPTVAPTAAPEAVTSVATTSAVAAALSPCDQFFVALDALSAEFVDLVDDGNRSLLLTIGQETPFAEGAEQLTAVADRLLEIIEEIRALGEPPQTLVSRVASVIEAIDQFAAGYAEGAAAAAEESVVGLNQSLGTVSIGTGKLQAASQTPAAC